MSVDLIGSEMVPPRSTKKKKGGSSTPPTPSSTSPSSQSQPQSNPPSPLPTPSLSSLSSSSSSSSILSSSTSSSPHLTHLSPSFSAALSPSHGPIPGSPLTLPLLHQLHQYIPPLSSSSTSNSSGSSSSSSWQSPSSSEPVLIADGQTLYNHLQRHLLCIEYPGHVIDGIENAVSTMGGMHQIAAAAHGKTKFLKVHYRDEPFAHPIAGDVESTTGRILLKVTRKVRRKPSSSSSSSSNGNSNPTSGPYRVDIMGRIQRNVTFKGLADFQMYPALQSSSPSSSSSSSPSLSSIDNGSSSSSRFELAPLIFSRFDYPRDYKFQDGPHVPNVKKNASDTTSTSTGNELSLLPPSSSSSSSDHPKPSAAATSNPVKARLASSRKKRPALLLTAPSQSSAQSNSGALVPMLGHTPHMKAATAGGIIDTLGGPAVSRGHTVSNKTRLRAQRRQFYQWSTPHGRRLQHPHTLMIH